VTTLPQLFRRYVATAPEAPAAVVWKSEDASEALSRRGLAERAGRMAAALRERGAGAGLRVVIAASNPLDFVVAFWAVQLVGGVAVPVMAPDERGRSVSALNVFSTICRMVEPAAIVATDPAAVEAALGDQTCIILRARDCPAPAGLLPDDGVRAPDDLAMIQFTSGSTSRPRGCCLTHRAVLANAAALVRQVDVQPLDTGVVWMPLYHDMGLMSGVIVPVMGLAATCLLTPAKFTANPLSWIRALSAFERTHTAGATFSLALVCQRLNSRPAGDVDLTGVQSILCGAERVDASVARKFLHDLAPLGLRPSALQPAYGLAETTVFACGRKEGLRVDRVAMELLQRSGEASPAGAEEAIEVVSVGRPPQHSQVRIMDAAGRPAAERVVGEVELRSPSTMLEYFKDPEATAQALRAGWLRTGDLGYLADGELFITGRLKELIIVRGRKIAPADIEHAVARGTGLLANRIAAIPVQGALRTEEIRIFVEARAAEPEALQLAVRRACFDACGVAPIAVSVLAPGGLPRTSSGKVQRALLAKAAVAIPDTLAPPGSRPVLSAALSDIH